MVAASDDPLGAALQVSGFVTAWSEDRVVFNSVGVPRREVVWRVTTDELRARSDALRPHAQEAWGDPDALGEYLLSVHLEQALKMFEGTEGVIAASTGGLRVLPA
ncbi:hypothetical protein [Serinicoccus sp. LYQ131]|uniref:hypothetical protein n=1 Tax=Serinicoccus sp. LYQ131 TaxID=3378797 RepID=UPI003853AC0E